VELGARLRLAPTRYTHGKGGRQAGICWGRAARLEIVWSDGTLQRTSSVLSARVDTWAGTGSTQPDTTRRHRTPPAPTLPRYLVGSALENTGHHRHHHLEDGQRLPHRALFQPLKRDPTPPPTPVSSSTLQPASPFQSRSHPAIHNTYYWVASVRPK